MNSIKAFAIATILFAGQIPVHATQTAHAETVSVLPAGAHPLPTTLPTKDQAVGLTVIIVSPKPQETPVQPVAQSASVPVPAAVRQVSVPELVARMASEAFDASQVDYVNWIIQHESSWNVTATNPSSGAYGLGQALHASDMAPFGSDYRTNPETQVKWLLNYIKTRYVTPQRAVAFWREHNWY